MKRMLAMLLGLAMMLCAGSTMAEGWQKLPGEYGNGDITLSAGTPYTLTGDTKRGENHGEGRRSGEADA